jgi:hypothetical protein
MKHAIILSIALSACCIHTGPVTPFISEHQILVFDHTEVIDRTYVDAAVEILVEHLSSRWPEKEIRQSISEATIHFTAGPVPDPRGPGTVRGKYCPGACRTIHVSGDLSCAKRGYTTMHELAHHIREDLEGDPDGRDHRSCKEGEAGGWCSHTDKALWRVVKGAWHEYRAGYCWGMMASPGDAAFHAELERREVK